MPRSKLIAYIVGGVIVIALIIMGVMRIARGDGSGEGNFNFFASLDLPQFSQFISNPSDLFIIKSADYHRISTASPFAGSGTACAHSGGHIHFSSAGKPYETDIITPVDGYISRVSKCFTLNAGTFVHDKFDISVGFAQHNGREVSLSYSIEPVAGENCKDNPDFYKQYILVEQGQQVKKGQVIARMPKFTNAEGSGTHIHFNLNWDGADNLICPNIFNSQVEKDFQKMNVDGYMCAGTAFPATFCYMPGPGEDLSSM